MRERRVDGAEKGAERGRERTKRERRMWAYVSVIPGEERGEAGIKGNLIRDSLCGETRSLRAVRQKRSAKWQHQP